MSSEYQTNSSSDILVSSKCFEKKNGLDTFHQLGDEGHACGFKKQNLP